MSLIPKNGNSGDFLNLAFSKKELCQRWLIFRSFCPAVTEKLPCLFFTPQQKHIYFLLHLSYPLPGHYKRTLGQVDNPCDNGVSALISFCPAVTEKKQTNFDKLLHGIQAR